MGYRVFRDSRGTEWQTWDVVPRLLDRRVNARRSRTATPDGTNRRSAVDRRVSSGPRPSLNTGLDGGWLCFEASEEKRRLAPIPTDWLLCPTERLEQYCAKAAAARRERSEPLPS